MTRDEIRPFALGEPCAQNKEGELLWSFDAIAQAVEEARAAERKACIEACRAQARALKEDRLFSACRGAISCSVAIRRVEP